MRVYENGDDLITEIREKWNRNLTSMRIWGFVAAIFMVVVGILCIVNPITTTYVIEVMASVALLLFGIWQIVRYIQRPVFIRTGVSLASGILNIILAILLLTSPRAGMLMYFGFLFGLNLLMLGFEQLTLTGRLKAVSAEGSGWLVAEGILNVIAGIILLMMPIASVAAVSVVLALYLIIGGVNLFMLSVNAKSLKA